VFFGGVGECRGDQEIRELVGLYGQITGWSFPWKSPLGFLMEKHSETHKSLSEKGGSVFYSLILENLASLGYADLFWVGERWPATPKSLRWGEAIEGSVFLGRSGAKTVDSYTFANPGWRRWMRFGVRWHLTPK